MSINKLNCAITSVAGWVPENKLTNKDLTKLVETSDEWITTRTGIKERRILRDSDKATAYMSSKAINRLLSKSKTTLAIFLISFSLILLITFSISLSLKILLL